MHLRLVFWKTIFKGGCMRAHIWRVLPHCMIKGTKIASTVDESLVINRLLGGSHTLQNI